MRWLPLLLVVACDSGPAPVAFEQYGIEGQAALCAWAVRCRHAPDDASCRRLLDAKLYDTRRAADGLRLGRLSYDPAAAGRCLAAGRAAECSALPFLDPSCSEVFTGLVVQGGTCTTGFDCSGGAPCDEPVCDAGCCAGVCGAPEPPPVEPVLAPVGGACNSHDDCVDTAYCEIDGRCHAVPRSAGAHCLYGCTFGDLFCEVNSETCHRFGRLGEPCGSQVLCNEDYSFCDGVCRQRPGLDEPCDGEHRHCVPGLNCIGGMCAARGGAGAGCTVDQQCDVACDQAAGQCAAYLTCAP